MKAKAGNRHGVTGAEFWKINWTLGAADVFNLVYFKRKFGVGIEIKTIAITFT